MLKFHHCASWQIWTTVCMWRRVCICVYFLFVRDILCWIYPEIVPFCQITRSDDRSGVHVKLLQHAFFSLLNLCFISYVIMLVCSTMLRSVPIYFIAKSCNFTPCHWKPLPVLKHNPGWDSSLCLAETFRAWQLKLLTLAFQSISLEFYSLPACLCASDLFVCLPSAATQQEEEGSWQ